MAAIPRIIARLRIGVIGVCAFAVGIGAAWIIHSKRQYQETAETVAQNLARVIESQTAESIGRISIALLATSDEIARQRSSGKADRQALDRFIERIRARLPGTDAIRVSNRAGTLVSGTDIDRSAGISVSDRPHFIRLFNDPQLDLAFSEPQRSRVNGRWVIVLARRIGRSPEAFDGIVFATIQLDSLSATLARLDVGPHGVIALRDKELGIIARYPEPDGPGSAIGLRLVPEPLRHLVEEGNTTGTIEALGGVDGVSRTYSWRQVAAYPLYAVVGLATQDYLAEWQWEALVVSALTALFIAAVLTSSWLLARAWLRQTESNLALVQREDELRLAHVAFMNSQEAIVVTDSRAAILDVNPAFTRITGYRREEVIGQNPRVLQSGRQDASFYRAMWQSLTRDGRWEGEFYNRRKDGEFYVQHAKISAVKDADGHITRYVAVASDVTQLKESQGRVEYLAYHDALTSLPNRTLLADRLKQAIAQADRRRSLLGVCYLDLDGFKPINDTWGHEVGDLLLIEVAHRLEACVRAGDTVARLGGDEFVVLLCDAADGHEIEQTTRRILMTLGTPFKFETMEATLTASIGVTVYPNDGQDPDTLIRHADQAMYAAKQAGKNRFRLFDPDHDRELRARLEVVARVEQGLAAGEFCLHYQPKVDMRQGTVVGVEALIRWQHPDNGLLSPAAFLPIVESSDCAITVGEWVLREAISQAADWKAQGLALPISINISGRHLQRLDFITSLSRLLSHFPSVRPESIELEILETTAMDDVESVSRIISACSALGVTFALDDFGTGYSSLTYLRRLPTHLLKIDQTFVRHMLDDPDDLAIVEGVIGLAQTFHRRVIAEGVETTEHGIPLMHLGCDLAQGYAIARPMASQDIPAWVNRWTVPPAWQEMAAIRWSRDDFPLLLAESHHRRWIDRMAAICQGTMSVDAAPPLGTHQCRFGQWLYGVGKNRYGQSPVFKALEPIHDKVHALGSELLELARSEPAGALGRVAELYAVRDELEQPLHELRMHVGFEREVN